MYALALPAPAQQHITIAQPAPRPDWLRYFDHDAALAAFDAHLESLPGARTPERHTITSYTAGLADFVRWSAQQLPTTALVEAYIADLLARRGLKPATVNSKYLAPVRLYLSKLAAQDVDIERFVDPADPPAQQFIVRNDAFRVSESYRQHITRAAAVKSPKAEVTTNVAPLWRSDFVRLSVEQVRATLRSIDRAGLLGLRDYALLHIAFSTGLRLAELARITLDAITPQGDLYLITVRGKRSNIDPVPISAAIYRDILAWVDAYNENLPAGDLRRIEGHTPLWQPLTRSGRHCRIGVNGYTPLEGCSHQALRDVIARRTLAGCGVAIAAHDTRRTTAAIAYRSGMNIPQIQGLLRHKDAATTLHYVGEEPDYAKRMLSSVVSFA